MSESSSPSPALVFDTINAYQKTAALKAAVEMDLFTAIGKNSVTAAELASRTQASEKGVRILSDFLTVLGFLVKSGDCYSLTPDSAIFLDRTSRGYSGDAMDFLLSSDIRGSFDRLADAVRRGGTAASKEGTMAVEHPVWVSFARTMGGLMTPAAKALAELMPLPSGSASRVLDISASHAQWGLAFSRRYPMAHLVALDWAPVLEVAKAAASEAGILERFSTIAGSAFDVDLGTNYDVVLIPNFLHHFNHADCVRVLRRVHASLRSGGRVAVVEFVPNPDRITPPAVAGFSLVMLATTVAGDAYTFSEYATMLAESGFQPPTAHPLPASMSTAVISVK